ncbi:diguanylate cyclase [Legionella sp. W05-934-2]|uniref:sensor domain-containing diguanylate cyclase n=1 Tax=Legionella sp. W05-934-2 TaxID=1198649 RepID=UPI003462E5A1
MNSFNKRKRLIVILLAFSLILSASIIVVEELHFLHNVKEIMRQNAFNMMKERENYLREFIRHSQQNIQAIRQSLAFKNYLKHLNHSAQIEAILIAYAKEHPDIMQIRFIDKKGNETIRVERRTEKDKPSVVDNDKLQNKAARYYFVESKLRELEKVWFSAIELNIENGKVEVPYKPTFRAVLPIKKGDEFGGILIINYFMTDFIKNLSSATLYDTILFNDKGNTIYHSKDQNKSWGNSLANQYHIASEFPQGYAQILSSPMVRSNYFISKKFDMPIHGGVHLILKLKESYLAQRQSNALMRYLLVSFIVLILSIILTYIIIKIYSRTLLNLDEVEALNESLNEASIVAKIGFWQLDNKSQKVAWSDSVYEIYEMPQSDKHITFDTLLAFMDEEEREKLQLEFANSIIEKRDYFMTHKIITGNNRVKFVEERGRHYFDKHGKLEKTIGSVYDITEKYYSEQKFLSLLENASDGIHILDKEGNLILYSKSFAANLGYSMEEAKHLTVYDWDDKLTEQQIKSAIQVLLNSQETFETKHRKKDGTVIDVQINAKGVEIEGEAYVYASQRDITLQNNYRNELEKTKEKLESANDELKKSLESLQLTTNLYENEKFKYKGILDLASDGIFLMDTDGKLVEYSKKAIELLGYSHSEMSNLTVYDWDKSITKKALKSIVDALYSHPIEIERVHTRKDGSTYIAYITANLQLIENVPYIYASVRDITVQKENESKILNSRNELETIFNTALEGIALIDLNKKYKKVNRKYCDLLEYSEEEMFQLDFFSISDPQDIEKSQEVFSVVLEKGYYENFERFCITKNGKKRRFRTSIALMPNKNEYLITTIDNTDLYDAFKTIEQQSYTDELTQLLNRKSYNEKIDEFLEQYTRYHTPFSLMIFDIDHFKSINDNYGHDVGDKVLVKLSNVVQSIIRKNDFFFRIGGEEFLVLINNTTLKGAASLAEKVRKAVEKKVNTIKNQKVTISIGVTEVQKDDTDDTIFKRADEYLYYSKDHGRNKVTAMLPEALN